MKHAYLIIAHNQWDLLKELLAALDDPRNDIYLHIDKKASPSHQELITCIHKARLFFTKQFNIVWGGTQMMNCTLSMLEEASKIGYSHYHLISGTDFPIKSQNYIHSYFESHPTTQFVGFDWPGINSGRFIERVNFYHLFINVIGKRDHTSPIHIILQKLEDLSLLIQHKLGIHRFSQQIYKGSSWFSITHSVVSAILESKSDICKQYIFTSNSDEIWLQSYLMNSEFSTQIFESNMRYIKWIQGNPSPEILTVDDYEDLIHSDKLFARKFDWSKDRQVLTKLKKYISED